MDDFLRHLDSKTKCCCSFMTVAVLLVTILTAISFGSIEPTEYGLIYHMIFKDIDQANIQEGGLQFIGPIQTIIKFPRTH